MSIKSENMDEEYLTVTEINNYISKKFKTDQKLTKVYIKGEISNYKVYSSGHGYFTLKDEQSKIQELFFIEHVINLNLNLKTG